MGILNRDEIERRLRREELIRFPRCVDKIDGKFAIEPASYDLSAGAVVWKESRRLNGKGDVQSISYKPEHPVNEQPTFTLHPGQMAFVITHEEILMPADLCGTVLSRNKLAREGILALNWGFAKSENCYTRGS